MTNATHSGPSLSFTISGGNTTDPIMAQKRRVTIQSDSEDEPPRPTQRKKQRTSAEDTNAEVEPVNNVIDEEEEQKFEREHEETFMQRIQERAEGVRKNKVIGVRLVPVSVIRVAIDVDSRVLRLWGSSKESKWLTSCVTHSSSSTLVPRLTSLSVSVFPDPLIEMLNVALNILGHNGSELGILSWLCIT